MELTEEDLRSLIDILARERAANYRGAHRADYQPEVRDRFLEAAKNCDALARHCERILRERSTPERSGAEGQG